MYRQLTGERESRACPKHSEVTYNPVSMNNAFTDPKLFARGDLAILSPDSFSLRNCAECEKLYHCESYISYKPHLGRCLRLSAGHPLGCFSYDLPRHSVRVWSACPLAVFVAAVQTSRSVFAEGSESIGSRGMGWGRLGRGRRWRLDGLCSVRSERFIATNRHKRAIEKDQGCSLRCRCGAAFRERLVFRSY